MIEEGLAEFMKQPSRKPTSETKETDDDKVFFDFLISAIKTISVDNKLAFRFELMQLVSRFRKSQNAEASSQSLLQPLSVQTTATSQGYQQFHAGNPGPAYSSVEASPSYGNCRLRKSENCFSSASTSKVFD
ncbi:hypothetical protein WA026_004266 [Henosepilachna vigintioctopunctata]|uniref:BESS domain-containing protein n=1 Tax=Henosepilachna vigintioctopunctata TaxID=420089 RepID=A0AAW1V8B7_9CUCU